MKLKRFRVHNFRNIVDSDWVELYEKDWSAEDGAGVGLKNLPSSIELKR